LFTAFTIAQMSLLKRESKNKHQAVSQASSFEPPASSRLHVEHLQEPRNAEVRPAAPFFNFSFFAFLDGHVNSNTFGAGTESFRAP